MAETIAISAGILLFSLGLPAVSLSQGTTDPPSRVLVEGEDLIYNVRYGFFDLGQVRIKILGKVRGPSYTVYEAKALIDSYPKVPFTDLHAIYESEIDSLIFSHHFVGRSKEKEYWDMSRYSFQYDRKRVLMEVADRDTLVTRRDTLALEAPMHDGLSLFFFARGQLYSHQAQNVPTLIKEQKVNTFINFSGDRTSVEIDGVEYPIDVVHFDGRADFVGIFGLTGGFEGWFSNDEARVPIMAKMKVIIGSVTIELMKWTRAGWNPPRAKE